MPFAQVLPLPVLHLTIMLKTQPPPPLQGLWRFYDEAATGRSFVLDSTSVAPPSGFLAAFPPSSNFPSIHFMKRTSSSLIFARSPLVVHWNHPFPDLRVPSIGRTMPAWAHATRSCWSLPPTAVLIAWNGSGWILRLKRLCQRRR